MSALIKTSSKINTMQMVRQIWSSKFLGTNNVLLARYGNVYEARGMHNVLALEHGSDVRRFKNTLRIGIPMNEIHTLTDSMKKNGYNMHVIYRGEGGAVYCHPFDLPDMRDRRLELSQQQRDRIRFEKLKKIKKKQISDEMKRRKSIYQEHIHSAFKESDGSDSSDDDDYGVNFVEYPTKKANL
jgi:hypothetical protein